MLEEKAWRLATAQFKALQNNLPTYISRDVVDEYHQILKLLETATGEDLSSFQVPESKFEPRVTSFRLPTRRSPGSATYSREKYCDSDFFQRKIDALAQYLKTIELMQRTQSPSEGPTDYWSMSDVELEGLASKYGIGGYADNTGHIDRSIIIRELLRRDRAMEEEKPPAHGHVINVGNMTGSVIQQGTTNSTASVQFNAADLQALLSKIKEELKGIPLSADARAEIQSDLDILEPQLSLPRPKVPIISACLQSMRTILQETGSHTAAILLAHEITKYLALLHS